MEIRTLEYFLAVIREGSITRAAESLHLTQPTLSRQLKDLEREFGKKLFNRGNRRIELTDAGRYLKKRAQEIVELAKRTENDLKGDLNIAGDIYVGAGETKAMRHLARVFKNVGERYPEIHFHVRSGDKEDLLDRLDNGLLDVCLILSDFNRDKYDYLDLPYRDQWVVVAHKDMELMDQESIRISDLWNYPLIVSRQLMEGPLFWQMFQKRVSELNIVSTYNLVYNAALMASERLGYVVTLADLVNAKGTDLIVRDLVPPREVGMSLVWKKENEGSAALRAFLEEMKKAIGQEEKISPDKSGLD